jgi:hypothetical protein
MASITELLAASVSVDDLTSPTLPGLAPFGRPDHSPVISDPASLGLAPFGHSDLPPVCQSLEELPDISTLPTTDAWYLPPLYNKGVNGERVWLIGFDGTRIFSYHGLTRGEKQTSYSDVVTNTSGRNLNEQAYLEARFKWTKMVRSGYSHSFSVCSKPMPALATILKLSGATGKKRGSALKPSHYPVAVSAKLDGVRVVARYEEGRYVFRSRLNKEYPWYQAIRDEVTLFMSYLPAGFELDGEFIIPGLIFHEGMKVIGRRDYEPPIEEQEKVRYYVFDVVDPHLVLTLEERIRVRSAAFLRYHEDGHVFHKVSFLTHLPVYNEEQLLTVAHAMIDMGYEGAVIRRLASAPAPDSQARSRYVRGRTVGMLKYKLFADKEVTVVGAEMATGNQAGAVVWVVQDEHGNVFRAAPEGSIEDRIQLYREHQQYIGKRATIKYQDDGEEGAVPRFPILVAFRDYE